ncbi:GNAT family N-acetyltransferase [Massilia glaciei]|uniref:N-acetyltransferase n=1 Tax=Massilia glaciei TaxID=1524097 RepID=A0A2U2I5U2_9BURK|nr:N-acetyltransferase [Massilia glaciei]PWF55126.1 N-acetyltransferase [Massilia glaciei]
MIMHTRLLTPGDVDAFRNLRLSGIEESPGVAWASYAEESAQTLEQTRQRLVATPYQMVFGVFNGEHLVAISGFKRESMCQISHRGNIWGLYVAPEARGQGVADKLIEGLLREVRGIPGLVQVTLVVSSDNEAARALYAKYGFIKTGVDHRSVCIDGHYHDEDRMVLLLDAD